MKETILSLYKKLPSWSKNRYFIKKSLQKDNIKSTSRMVGEELKLKSKGSYKN